MDDDDATSALHMLRRIDAKVEGLSVEIRELTLRMTRLSDGFAGLHGRTDPFDVRRDRVERRLESYDTTI
jgi:hypothetical protein